MVEGGGIDGGGGTMRASDGSGQLDASNAARVSGGGALLPMDATLERPKVEKETSETSATAMAGGVVDGSGLRDGVNGEEQQQNCGAVGCALMEVAGMPPPTAQRVEIAVVAPRSSPSPRLVSPNSRMMDLSSILNVQTKEKEAMKPAADVGAVKERGGDGAGDVEMGDERAEVDVEMAEPSQTASVSEVETEPRMSKNGHAMTVAERTDADVKMVEEVIGVEESFSAANDQNEQAKGPEEQSTATATANAGVTSPLDESTAASLDEQVEGAEPIKTPPESTDEPVDKEKQSAGAAVVNDPTSASGSTNEGAEEPLQGMPVESVGEVQSAVVAVATEQQPAVPVGTDSGAQPRGATTVNTSSSTGRSTRYSRKKPSRGGEAKHVSATSTPASKHPMYADLTLEIVSGGGDASATTRAKAPSKKRSQRAPKAATATPARSTKRSRTHEKQFAAGAEDDDPEDDEVMFVKQQPAPTLPPRARSRKRRQMTEDSDLLEPPPIINNPPPLPFTTTSPRRSSSHSASPNRGAPMDRACEFCNHAVDMCALLICKACRRAYHVRCLVRRFKKHWPAEGSIETRLKKLQEEARDRRVSLFRCSSCRAAFAEFVDTPSKFLEPCTCPTCAQPELLAIFRRNKLLQMLQEMNEPKAMSKQGTAAKTSAASVTSDASADSGSGETKKKPSRLTRGSSADQDADGSAATRGGAARRKSLRPVRRGGVVTSDSDATNENSMEDVITGFSTAENSPTKQSATDASESGAAPSDATTALVMDDAARALTELSLADAQPSQAASVPVTAEKSGDDSIGPAPDAGVSERQEGQTKARAKKSDELLDKLLNLVDLYTAEGMVWFPIVCLRSRLDLSDASKRADANSRFFSVPKFKGCVVGSGECAWVSRKIFVKCSCCHDKMQLGAFAKHCGLVLTGKELRHNLLVVHRNDETSTPFERFISAIQWKNKIHGSVEAAFSSAALASEDIAVKTPSNGTRQELAAQEEADVLNIKIPRKKHPAVAPAAADSGADTKRQPSLHDADMLNSLNADFAREIKRKAAAAEIDVAFQRVKEVMLVKRNRQSKMSHAIRDDAADTNADPLDYLLKVVSLHPDYVAVTADGTHRDRMFELPPRAAKRRVGWLALSAARRFSRSIYCECCEKALSVDDFIKHSDLRPDDRKHLALYIMERVSPSRVQSFAQFCRNAALVAREDGDKSFAAVLKELQEFPAAPAAPYDAAAS